MENIANKKETFLNNPDNQEKFHQFLGERENKFLESNAQDKAQLIARETLLFPSLKAIFFEIGKVY